MLTQPFCSVWQTQLTAYTTTAASGYGTAGCSEGDGGGTDARTFLSMEPLKPTTIDLSTYKRESNTHNVCIYARQRRRACRGEEGGDRGGDRGRGKEAEKEFLTARIPYWVALPHAEDRAYVRTAANKESLNIDNNGRKPLDISLDLLTEIH